MKNYVIEKENDVLAAYLFKKTKILGFDTESKPTFKRSFFQVSLIQFTTMIAFLFRINKIGFNEKLIDIISDKKIKKIG